MLKTCECGKIIPNSVSIGGKRRNLQNRTKCLDCLPFGKSRYRKKTKEEKLEAGANKSRRHYNKVKTETGKDPIRWKREQRKAEIVEILGGACQLCGYNKTVRNLTFHHLRDKEFSLSSRSFQFSMNKIVGELKKCVLVCHNCHGEIHEGIIAKSVVEKLNKRVISLLKGR